MKQKVLNILGWVLGIGGIIGGIQQLLTNNFSLQSIAVFLYSLLFAVILVPPISNKITHSNHPRLIRLGVVLGIVGIVIWFWLKQPEIDRINREKQENLGFLISSAQRYCKDKGSCATSLDVLDKSGYLKNLPTSVKLSDFLYKQLKNGKDCLIETKLLDIFPSGKTTGNSCSGNLPF